MTYRQDVTRAQAAVTGYLSKAGARCTVQGLTYNAQKDLYEPPYVTKKAHVYCFIASLSSLRNPNVTSTVQAMNISFEAYRQITMPVRVVAIRPGDHIVREPVTGASDTYEVVEAVQADETSPLTLILHCQKI